jgi:hypothetical protein
MKPYRRSKLICAKFHAPFTASPTYACRLKHDYDISSFSPEAQAILQALKTCGMILADNGSDNFISGTHDPRWNADAIGERSSK